MSCKGCKITILKLDEKTKHPIEGVRYYLYNNCYSAFGQTNIKGKVTFENLEKGHYELIEIGAPDGYIIDRQIKYIYIDACCNIYIGVDRLVFENKQETNDCLLTISKVDDNKKELYGATFSIFDGITEIEQTTNEFGKAYFHLPLSSQFILKETKCPIGYKKDEEEHIVSTDSNSNIYIDGVAKDEIEITNTLETIDITVNINWIDDNNKNDTRPNVIDIALYQNGMIYRVYTHQVLSGHCVFEKVPIYDELGIPYVYTINGEDLNPYNKTTIEFNILYQLKVFYITVYHTNITDENNPIIIIKESYLTEYGDDLSIFSKPFPGYYLIGDKSYYYSYITHDDAYTFQYKIMV